MIQESNGKFKCAIAISGDAMEQCEHYVPELIDLLKKLADTGKVEFLGEPYGNSLASLADVEEFELQVKIHSQKIKTLFGQTPKVFRNTELIYCDEMAPMFAALGFKGAVTEGAKHILGWKSPNYVYAAATAPKLQAAAQQLQAHRRHCAPFFRHELGVISPHRRQIYGLDCSHPPRRSRLSTLCMNLDTFGELQPRETGIFQFP